MCLIVHDDQSPGCDDRLLFQKTNTMPGKATAGQGESAMAVSDAEGGSGGAEVSLAAIALLGETSAYVGQTMVL